jgi:thiol:disulfide interchange protein DsbC
MRKKLLTGWLLAMVAGAAVADATQTAATDAIRSTLGRLNMAESIEGIEQSPVAGLYQVELTGGRLLYATPDGQQLIQGAIFDVSGERPRNLTAEAEARGVARTLDAIPAEELITFAPAEPKTHVTIFTDVDCGYCRKLHLEMEELNALGIEVRYAAFPRSGMQTPTATTMQSIWCAKDRQAAMTRAKEGKSVPAATCDNPLERHYELGQQIGVQGTPAIFLANGRLIPGYQPAAQLALEALDNR